MNYRDIESDVNSIWGGSWIAVFLIVLALVIGITRNDFKAIIAVLGSSLVPILIAISAINEIRKKSKLEKPKVPSTSKPEKKEVKDTTETESIEELNIEFEYKIIDFTGDEEYVAPARHESLILKDGREVFVDRIYQTDTYGLFLAGGPDKKRNERRMNEVIGDAKKKGFVFTTPYIIPPIVKKPIYTEEYKKEHCIKKEYEYLPKIICFAELMSKTPAKDDTMFGSALVVVWFQESLAFPIDPGITKKLKEIDWALHSKDYEP